MGFNRTWLAVCSYSDSKAADAGATPKSPAVTSDLHARRARLAAFMAQLISRPAKHDRVLDLTFCAELTAADFAAAAVALRHTSMFSGLRLYDVAVGDAVISLCECARLSGTLETLALSGVLPVDASMLNANMLKRSPAKLLGEALAAGAADGKLALKDLDLSDNDRTHAARAMRACARRACARRACARRGCCAACLCALATRVCARALTMRVYARALTTPPRAFPIPPRASYMYRPLGSC